MKKSPQTMLARYTRAVGRLFASPAYRSALRLRLLKPAALFQPSNTTAPDRYPLAFDTARALLRDVAEPALLSFGCSTGEEVFSLRRWFAQARIKGLDINGHNIAVCRQRLRAAPDAHMRFERADTVAGEPAGHYDGVFCMAIFRHGSLADPRYTRCDALISFERFAAEMAQIDRVLKPGGLLFIAHSNFRFTDTPVAIGYEVILRQNLLRDETGVTPIFDRDNQRTDDETFDAIGFRKSLNNGAPA